MKKRLSEESWFQKKILIAFFGLTAVLGSALRAVSASGEYGVVSAEIPVMHVPADDPLFKALEPQEKLDKATPVVVLTEEEFLFGPIEAFTTRITDVRNKFAIKHEDGAPRLDLLAKTMGKWLEGRKEQNPGVVILLPADNIPAPIVVQIIDGLKLSHFKHVILAGGLL